MAMTIEWDADLAEASQEMDEVIAWEEGLDVEDDFEDDEEFDDEEDDLDDWEDDDWEDDDWEDDDDDDL